jgi:hypothetical protein
MKTSETINKIAGAFLVAQQDVSTVIRNKKVNSGTFNYSYAELSEIVEQVYEKLNTNGIIVNQPVNGEYVNTRLTHTSGEYFEDDMGCKIINAKENNPQAYGSGITYARRYGLLSMLGIAMEDDDGKKAMPESTSYDMATEQVSEVTSQNDVMERFKSKMIGKECNECHKGTYVKSVKGNIYCSEKCWVKKDN